MGIVDLILAPLEAINDVLIYIFRSHMEYTPRKRNISVYTLHHLVSFYSFYKLYTGPVNVLWETVAFATFYGYLGGIGITAGAHRLWCHQSYKAKTPLKIILMLFNTFALQDPIYTWVRDHRVHHKFVETDADPYNAKRGFFFSHLGWILTKKHDKVVDKLKAMDMSDLEADPVVMFQYKYYFILVAFFVYLIPFVIPLYFFGESMIESFYAVNIRIVLSTHTTFLVNSAAHMWGNKPYDKTIGPVENRFVSFFALGEGWHNYHHVFPWDYKTSELGDYSFNLSTGFIDFFAWLGWAYDLKTVPKSMIEKRKLRTGEGSKALLEHNHNLIDGSAHDHVHENTSWGWGDNDISQEHLEFKQALFSKDVKQ